VERTRGGNDVRTFWLWKLQSGYENYSGEVYDINSMGNKEKCKWIVAEIKQMGTSMGIENL
jgi:hypothetical protein